MNFLVKQLINDSSQTNVYLVGGAVRDELLGINSQDNDWVVVGSHSQAMLDAGFSQVGKDFPVFLHPETKEEYALARTERKSGKGYQGFEFDVNSTITLEEDLSRRDLTVNAIAKNTQGDLIDPFNGQKDLEDRILRHVSPAFVEDPLRVLRVARFVAQLSEFNFELAPETLQLMQTIVKDGEIEHLSPERVWQETARALLCPNPHLYIQTLHDCGALEIIFPEIDALFGVPQHPKYHPEIDSGIHTLMVLEQTALNSDSLAVRFAALMHDLGKGTTPKKQWPHHRGHEQRSYDLLQNIYQRLPIPNHCQLLANHVALYHFHVHIAFELEAKDIYALLKSIDAFRRPDIFEEYLIGCLGDYQGRTGYEQQIPPEQHFLRQCLQVCEQQTAQHVIQSHRETTGETLSGKAIGDALEQARIDAISQLQKEKGYPL